jgi:hypothetical protein
MANTVSVLSYLNTFGDLIIQQNSVAIELNNLGANNYTKNTGSLIINSTGTSLQVNDTAVIQTAIINGTLNVKGDVTAQANLTVLGLGTATVFANTATANTLVANNFITSPNIISTLLVTSNNLTSNTITVGTLNNAYLNSAYSQANTGTIQAIISGQTAAAAFNQANSAFNTADASFVTANNAFPKTGGTLTGTTVINTAGGYGLGIYGANTTAVNYGAAWTMRNTSGGATLPSKTFRINPIGSYEIVNNANNEVISALSDSGNYTISGTLFSGAINCAEGGINNAGNYFTDASGGVDKDIGWNFGSGRYAYFFGRSSDYNIGLYDSGAGIRWTTNPSGDLYCVGNVTAYSDRRLKSNIETIENALAKVLQLRGVSFDKSGVRGLGLIAQETQTILPEVVLENSDDKMLSVAYGNIVGVLVEAIKELKAEIDELKKSK